MLSKALPSDWLHPPVSRFARAVEHFSDQDVDLLTGDLSERCITHKLGEKLQLQFSDFYVDCEYNRMFKKGQLAKKEIDSALRGRRVRVFPDIIVHDRVSAERNFVAVEVCGFTASTSKILKDKAKIEAYVNGKMKYRFGVLIHFRNFTGAFLYWLAPDRTTGQMIWKRLHSSDVSLRHAPEPKWNALYTP